MKKLSLTLYLFFLTTVWADMTSSLLCFRLGHIESNPLYYILGGLGFWTLYITINISVMTILMIAERKYWWVNLIILIPSIAHLICTINNMGLIWR